VLVDSGGVANTPPAVNNNTGATVNQFSTANVIGQAQLEFTDAEQGAADLDITFDTVPASGTLYIDNAPNNGMPDGAGEILSMGETITQADINNNLLKYDHAGSTANKTFQVDVSDGQGGAVNNQVFTIMVTPQPEIEVKDGAMVTDTDIPVNTGTAAFGAVNVGSPSMKTFTIVNIGGAGLLINNIASTGGSSGDYVVSGHPAFPFIINPGNNQTFVVTFTPGAAGARNSTLRINNNDPTGENPFDFNLTGSGVVPFTTEVTVAAGILTINDVAGANSADQLQISYNAGMMQYTVTDTGGLIIDASSIAGSAGNLTASVTIPAAGITGLAVTT